MTDNRDPDIEELEQLVHSLMDRLGLHEEKTREALASLNGAIDRLAQQIDRLEAGAGTEGWIGTLAKEVAAAVMHVEQLNDEAKKTLGLVRRKTPVMLEKRRRRKS